MALDAGRVMAERRASRTFALLFRKIEEKSAITSNAFQPIRFHKTRPISIFGYAHFMAMTLPLHKMTVPEKLRAMEALWEDLSRNSDALKSPGWHEAALNERKARLAAGKTSYMDWERAKKEIRRRVA